jgi:DNA-binding transcriptional regulator YiaG
MLHMKKKNIAGQIEMRPYAVVIPTSDGSAVADEITVEVPMEWSEVANAWLITPEAEAIIESTKARYMGLVTPERMAALRERLNLTQAEMGELLCIGEKSWTRWESGRHRPSQSLNLLIRALEVGLLSTYDLRWLRNPEIDWRPVLKSRTRQVTLSISSSKSRHIQSLSPVAGLNEDMNVAA